MEISEIPIPRIKTSHRVDLADEEFVENCDLKGAVEGDR